MQVARDEGHGCIRGVGLKCGFGQAVVGRSQGDLEISVGGIETIEQVIGVQGDGLPGIVHQLQVDTFGRRCAQRRRWQLQEKNIRHSLKSSRSQPDLSMQSLQP